MDLENIMTLEIPTDANAVVILWATACNPS
jgi:hypothetical protein